MLKPCFLGNAAAADEDVEEEEEEGDEVEADNDEVDVDDNKGGGLRKLGELLDGGPDGTASEAC